MSQLLVDDIVNKDDTGAPGLSRGIVVTGVTTSTSGEFTSSAVIGYGVTINGTGIQLAAGIVTAFCTKVGSAVTINPSGIDAISGIVTANTLKGTTGTFSGTVTANAFSGDGGDLTGLNIPAGFTELDAALFN
tara:strand:- start:6 stop:404 length:399 start_codon:yes stop_codon:yes gene_type:complete